MKRIIELDVNDIKKLIYEEYGVKPKDIEWECSEPDSSYQNAGFVIFRFEEKQKGGDDE